MEAYLAPTQPTQVNKITALCEICSGPMTLSIARKIPNKPSLNTHPRVPMKQEVSAKWYTFKAEQNNLGDTYNPSWRSHPNLRWRQPQNSQNNFSNPPNQFQLNGSFPNRSFNNRPQNFNNQSNLEGLVSNFMASQDARLSKFEADFKQQQSEMTNKIDTVLKAITNRIAGALPSDTVKNLKLSTSPILSARSYPSIDPQCSTLIHSSINAITIHPKQQSDSNNDKTKENAEEEMDSLKNTHSMSPDPSILFITKKVLKFNSLFESLGLVPPSPNAKLICIKEEDGDAKEDKKEKEDRRCFRCGDPNHFINDCPKHSFKDQKAFVVECWSDSGDDSKKEEICLMAQSNEVQSDTPYYSSSSLDNESSQDEYDKLCKISLRIINKNKHLKAKNQSLKRDVCELKSKIEQLERNKEISHECESYDKLVIEISSLKLKLASFENISSSLRKMVEMQKPLKDKYGLGYTEDIASTSNNKIKNLGPLNDKMLSVESATPVPSKTEPACSDEQIWLSAAKTKNAEKAKILESNIVKKNDSVRLKVNLELDEWIKDSGYTKHMTGNKDLFSSYKAIDGDYLTKFDLKSTEGVFLGYSSNSKAYVILNKKTMRVKESLNVKFDESPPPKSPPLVDDDILENDIIENQDKDLEIKENEPLNKE
ncbi:MAK10-like protein [Tanacetum coccineum]